MLLVLQFARRRCSRISPLPFVPALVYEFSDRLFHTTMMTTRSFTYYTDAGSSYSPKSNGLSSEMTRTSLETEYATAYDEFCLMIRT